MTSLRSARIGFALLLAATSLHGAAAQQATPQATAAKPTDPRIERLKTEALAKVEARAKQVQEMVDMVFSFGELGMQEFETSKYLTGILEQNGFTVERGVARVAKGAAVRMPAQPPDGFAAHPDMLACGGDAAAVGQLLDEGELPLDGPAVVAGADGHRFKGDEGCVLGHCASGGRGEPVISCRGL